MTHPRVSIVAVFPTNQKVDFDRIEPGVAVFSCR